VIVRINDEKILVAKWVIVGLVILIMGGFLSKRAQIQMAMNGSMFNMALIEKDWGVTFISFDPTENQF
jgi:hypothetical protein